MFEIFHPQNILFTMIYLKNCRSFLFLHVSFMNTCRTCCNNVSLNCQGCYLFSLLTLWANCWLGLNLCQWRQTTLTGTLSAEPRRSPPSSRWPLSLRRCRRPAACGCAAAPPGWSGRPRPRMAASRWDTDLQRGNASCQFIVPCTTREIQILIKKGVLISQRQEVFVVWFIENGPQRKSQSGKATMTIKLDAF